MTRENEISIASCAYGSRGSGIDFEAGAKWADANPKSPWISVEDDLPCNHEEMIHVVVENVELRTDRVLAMTDDGIIIIAYMYKFGSWPWHWSETEKITHWMPIPKFKED